MSKRPITVVDVARKFGISRTQVIRLDEKLAPRRSETGVRIYDPHRVAREAERRRKR